MTKKQLRNLDNIHYVYIFLDPRQPGRWEYKDWVFLYRPFYVGIGRGNRINMHFTPSYLALPNNKNNILYSIQKETGGKPLTHKLYEKHTLVEAENIEIDIISHFGRIDLKTGILSNMTKGGSGVQKTVRTDESRERQGQSLKGRLTGRLSATSRSLIQYSLEGEFIKLWESRLEASRELNIARATITRAIKSQSGEARGFIWRDNGSLYEKPINPPKPGNCRSIYQYSFEGLFIAKFNSLIEAAESINAKYTTSILRSSQSISYTSHGFRWSYDYLGESVDVPPNHSKKPVACYDDNMNLIKIFESGLEAKRQLGESIFYALKDPNKKLYGFYWRYVDLLGNIKER